MTGQLVGPGYQPRFDIDYADGRQGELLVRDVLRQIAAGDSRDYKLSGLATTDAEYWAFVKPNGCILLAPTFLLKDRCRHSRKVDGGLSGDNPTRGYLVGVPGLLVAS